MKMAEIYGFQQLSRKLVVRSSSNLECTLVWWTSSIDSLLGCTGPISAMCCQKLTENGGFWPLSRKLITQSTSSWCNFTYWVSVYFLLGLCLPNFIPLLSKEKWLKMVFFFSFTLRTGSHLKCKSNAIFLKTCRHILWSTWISSMQKKTRGRHACFLIILIQFRHGMIRKSPIIAH